MRSAGVQQTHSKHVQFCSAELMSSAGVQHAIFATMLVSHISCVPITIFSVSMNITYSLCPVSVVSWTDVFDHHIKCVTAQFQRFLCHSAIQVFLVSSHFTTHSLCRARCGTDRQLLRINVLFPTGIFVFFSQSPLCFRSYVWPQQADASIACDGWAGHHCGAQPIIIGTSASIKAPGNQSLIKMCGSKTAF